MDKLIIVGAGGHGKVVADAAICSREFSSVSFLDAQFADKKAVLGCPVIGDDSRIEEMIEHNYVFVVAIGDNKTRAEKYARLIGYGASLANVIHPRATISDSVAFGKGCVVLAGAIINTDASIKDNVIVNTGSVIEHDAIIGSHAHVAPGAVLTGNCQLGALSLFGAGAIAIPGKKIGAAVVVGAGAVVVGDIPDGQTAVGIPAKW